MPTLWSRPRRPGRGERVAELTRLVRLDDGEPWARVRHALTTQGVRLHRSAIAECTVRGDESVFGIVFTQNGLVHEFLLTAGTDGLADWHNITDRWRESPHAEAIEDALFLNAQGREQG